MKELEKIILELGELAHRSHYHVDEDDWYSCPKAPNGCLNDAVGTECNCGADEHNAKVDEIVKKALLLNKWGKVLDPNYSNNSKAILLEAQETPIIKYVVANCGFYDLEEAWNFKEKMGFPDNVCSGNMFEN